MVKPHALIAARVCSWSPNDHEDGGPTVYIPAAERRCTRGYFSLIVRRFKGASRRCGRVSAPAERPHEIGLAIGALRH